MSQQGVALVRGLAISFILLFAGTHAGAQILAGVGSSSSGVSVPPSWGTPTEFFASTASGTTSAVPSVTIAAGNLVVIMARVLSPVFITGTDVAGSTTDCGVRASAATNRSIIVCAYIVSASAVSNATVTVNFSGTNGGARTDIRVYPYSNGTPALDAMADLSASASVASPFAGPGLTLTGSSDVVFEAGSAFNGSSSTNVTAVDGSWTRTRFSAAGFADQASVTSISAPNWTATTPTIKATAAVAFGFSPTSCTVSGMQDFSAGTNNTAPAAADLWTSQQGLAGFTNPSITGTSPGYWAVNTPSTFLFYSTSAHKALNTAAPRFCFGGATYSDSGSLGMRYDTTGGAVARTIQYFTPWETGNPGTSGACVGTMVYWLQTSLTTGSAFSMTVISALHTPASGQFVDPQLWNTASQLRIKMEGVDTDWWDISADAANGGWVQVATKSDCNVGAAMRIYDASGNILTSHLGITEITSSYAITGTAANVDYFQFGNVDGFAFPTGKTIDFDKVKICYQYGTACPWPINE